jgi:hypothetical protein
MRWRQKLAARTELEHQFSRLVTLYVRPTSSEFSFMGIAFSSSDRRSDFEITEVIRSLIIRAIRSLIIRAMMPALIDRVIFEPAYLPKLFAMKRGPLLRKQIHFVRGKAWWRHDEHYHVDFKARCRPLSAFGR